MKANFVLFSNLGPLHNFLRNVIIELSIQLSGRIIVKCVAIADGHLNHQVNLSNYEWNMWG